MRGQRRYFAYGSNLCAAQMAARCPKALEEGVVELSGWRLIINGRGVATLVPDPEARVFGLVWRLTPACEAALDRHEGVARGVYRKAELEAGGAPALVYWPRTPPRARRGTATWSASCGPPRCAASIPPTAPNSPYGHVRST